tara:strand:+ start:92 stop:463 length:372 start_codon:yes stop_codon:yes gene_type:complete
MVMNDYQECLDNMVGRVVKYVDVDHDQMKITCEDNSVFTFYHEQDCCESVYIYETEGEPMSLKGWKLLLVDMEATREDNAPYDESRTTTVVKFITNENTVSVKWIGESNGYYSESVDLKQFLA